MKSPEKLKKRLRNTAVGAVVGAGAMTLLNKYLDDSPRSETLVISEIPTTPHQTETPSAPLISRQTNNQGHVLEPVAQKLFNTVMQDFENPPQDSHFVQQDPLNAPTIRILGMLRKDGKTVTISETSKTPGSFGPSDITGFEVALSQPTSQSENPPLESISGSLSDANGGLTTLTLRQPGAQISVNTAGELVDAQAQNCQTNEADMHSLSLEVQYDFDLMLSNQDPELLPDITCASS